MQFQANGWLKSINLLKKIDTKVNTPISVQDAEMNMDIGLEFDEDVDPEIMKKMSLSSQSQSNEKEMDIEDELHKYTSKSDFTNCKRIIKNLY